MYIFLLRLWLQITPCSISVPALESLGKETHCENWRLGKDGDVGRGHSATCYTGSRMFGCSGGESKEGSGISVQRLLGDNFSGLIIFEARNGYRFAKVVVFGTNRGHQRDEAITREIDADQAEI